MTLVNSNLTPSIVEPNLPEDLSGSAFTLVPGVVSPYAAGANGYATAEQAEGIVVAVSALQTEVSQVVEIFNTLIAALNARRVFTGLTVEEAT